MKTAALLKQHDHGMRWGKAFAAGLRRHGFEMREGRPDLLVMWSVRQQYMIANQIALGGDVCILECGYIGNRLEWASASLGGGLNGRGRFGPPMDNGERFENICGGMKPWKDPGGYALICGQVPGDMSVVGVDLAAVYQDVAAQCRDIGFEPVFRPHPICGMDLPGVDVLEGDLAAALAGAAFVVSWNSNSGVDAALACVPVVALDRGSMAWEIASHSVTSPWLPNRREWARALAWKQWTIEEMESGQTWDVLKHSARREATPGPERDKHGSDIPPAPLVDIQDGAGTRADRTGGNESVEPH